MHHLKDNNVKKIKKILVANRGEIASRIIKTARRIGISTVAIHSDADFNAPFVGQADEAVCLNGIHCNDTYLNIAKVIDAAKACGADAIHPGYGFLSENAEFVRRVEAAGITFIGPNANAIDTMGDKVKAKDFAIKAGVTVVPGFLGTIDNPKQVEDIIDSTGLPVIVKAAAGGGGKGMRIVHNKAQIMEAIDTARNEARKSFGDDRVFIEKFIENPKHIEIQIAADRHGNIVCLGERECSIQRFNQKIIEESPSPFLDPETRKSMYEQSLKLVAACHYCSVGTVEFIMDPNRKFYFLEMNTRLQVEHTVTEYVTKMDLVELMIQLTQGQPLSIKQEDVKIEGWSIEARICAEDPTRGFLPSIGRITNYIEPQIKHNVRVDSGVVRGSEISPFYDSMIGKLITFGTTRNEAIQNMRNALGEFVIDGISTNLNLLESIIHHDEFVSGNFTTAFMQQYYPRGFNSLKVSIDDHKVKPFILCAIAVHLGNDIRFYSYNEKGDIFQRNLTVILNDKQQYEVEVIEYSKQQITLKYQGDVMTYSHDYQPGNRVMRYTLNSESCPMKINYIDGSYYLHSKGVSIKMSVLLPQVAQLMQYMPLDKLHKVSDKLLSPISGIVVKIKVQKSMSVTTGQELLVIEAMKMENTIHSENDTFIKDIVVTEGSIVSQGDPLLLYS